jgi:hypothetical protein
MWYIINVNVIDTNKKTITKGLTMEMLKTVDSLKELYDFDSVIEALKKIDLTNVPDGVVHLDRFMVKKTTTTHVVDSQSTDRWDLGVEDNSSGYEVVSEFGTPWSATQECIGITIYYSEQWSKAFTGFEKAIKEAKILRYKKN